jgi:hypothetical protein
LTRAAACLLALSVSFSLAGCREREPVDYSKQPRIPDDQGQVSEIDFESVKLDGRRTYAISSEVQSFSTYTGQVASLLSWKNKYIHIGINQDKQVIWVAGVGVIDTTVNPPVVRYTNGTLRKVEGRRVFFADGTVFRVDESVKIPPLRSKLKATIDPKRHVVVDLRGTAE